MSIVRIERKSRFTTIPNEVIEDSRLSYRARGVLAYLLSKPDHWAARSEQLVTEGIEGRDAIRTALRELEQVGYLIRSKEQDHNGRWSTVTVIRDHTGDGFSGAGTPKPGKPASGHPAVGKPGATAKTEQQELISSEQVTTTATQSSSPRRRALRSVPTAYDPADAVNRAIEAEQGDPEPEPEEIISSRPGRARVTYGSMSARMQNSPRGLARYFAEAQAAHCQATGDVRIGINESPLRALFKKTLDSGVMGPDFCREMVDVFFAAPELNKATRKVTTFWKLFIMHADECRVRVGDQQKNILAKKTSVVWTKEEQQAWLAEVDAV